MDVRPPDTGVHISPGPISEPIEGVKTENDHINLKVAGQDGSVVQFKIKRHTPLNKLMKAYCERQVSLFRRENASPGAPPLLLPPPPPLPLLGPVACLLHMCVMLKK
ncbi:Small ubiquitin-related modifier 3 [Liparis tanakae]|uniref:Small ubiquitin-related modifier 3 n=1 Tax=Liparis tanakae TaxID=230148 RepID=A0A4Z2J3G5_9TELE|nr:Small ubiquitin-related modifier 3 [Liparis tanakae]